MQRQLIMHWWGYQQIKWEVSKQLKVENLPHYPAYGPGLIYRQKMGSSEVHGFLQLFHPLEADTELYLSGKQLGCFQVFSTPAPGPQGNILGPAHCIQGYW